ncbi:hypothetical protein NPIL_410891 [Nephila pilipes]|uniref:Uncharacterized protein n=1 Tax=Nephila pilipes TaxID=299642 RepID=A0A8X6JPI2_NEPPI|nr:hypothetical protein NPIL_410891 [Nephila pilipes]
MEAWCCGVGWADVTARSIPHLELSNIPDISHDAGNSAGVTEDIKQEYELKNQVGILSKLLRTREDLTAAAYSRFFCKKPKNNNELELILKGHSI